MMDDKLNVEYYVIVNTISEWATSVTGRYRTLHLAQESLKDKSDWFGAKGSGTIYKVTLVENEDGTIEKTREIVFKGNIFNKENKTNEFSF